MTTHASIDGSTGEIYDVTNSPDDNQWLDLLLGKAFWPNESPSSQELYSSVVFNEAKAAITQHMREREKELLERLLESKKFSRTRGGHSYVPASVIEADLEQRKKEKS